MSQASGERVRDLFEIPEALRKGDFVVKLTEGIERAEETVGSYVVTPALVDAFDRALGLVHVALGDTRSRAAYLHGSFGSGKSHFMALLSLLLAGREEAWTVPELHPLRAKYAFVGQKRALELHFHMMGEDSLEAAIFRGYVRYVAENHSSAPVPPLFADEGLFASARALLEELGEERFLAPLNAGASDGWGDLAGNWTRATFEAAASSPDPDERARLFSALVKSPRFAGWADQQRGFIGIDEGLAVLARHANGLGFDYIVLFLDELILWLSHRAADNAWLHREIEKMVKLVEASEMARAIPIVSFIARQRKLSEMVGEQYTGADQKRLEGSLEHWKGRYDEIVLEDRNLPAIVEKRILRPRGEDARRTLDAAFEAMQRAAGPAWQTLLGSDDRGAFRKLYPFSPALVETLVSLSNVLQRQRTAIKLLMEILVEHISDLKLGEVVRVGDLFDVLAGGEEPADGVTRARFETARQLYRYQLLPLLHATHGTGSETRCQRLRPDHPTRLGCAGCPEAACRTDNRLLKTLLVAALVPEVGPLKDLTASRLVQLNHGTFKVPVPGTEARTVAQKLRHMASQVAQLRVGGEADPRVHIELTGVDVGPILDLARDADSPGARQRVLRELLFDALGIEVSDATVVDHKVEWRHTWRHGQIVFGNVRKMGAEALRCPEGDDWRLVIDYPFDEPGYGPSDDLEAVQRYVAEGGGSWTAVWLPSFFGEATNRMVGELVVLEHILHNRETTTRYVAHLSVENQLRARLDLESLRSSKRGRVLEVLAMAYGLMTPKESDLDSSRTIERHLHALKPGAELRPAQPAGLADAIDPYVEALLAARWPRHPEFGVRLTPKVIERALARFGDIMDAEDRRIPVDREDHALLRGTLGELGIVRVTESAALLVDDRTLKDIDRRRQQKAEERPTAGQVRGWLDEGGKLGLQPEAADLVVRAYARSAARALVQAGRPYEPRAGQPIPPDVILERPELPGAAEWKAGLDMAGAIFGIAGGRALHADNLKRFASELEARVSQALAPAGAIPALMAPRLAALGQAADAPRARTARSAAAILGGLHGRSPVEAVRTLAGFEPETSARSVAQSIAHASATAVVLGDELVFGALAQLEARRAEPAAVALLERAAAALRQDEVNSDLAAALRQIALEAQAILRPPAPQDGAAGPPVWSRSVSARGRDAVRRALGDIMREVEAALGEAGDIELVGQLELRRRS